MSEKGNDAPFFPNRPPQVMRSLHALIPIVRELAPASRMRLYEILSGIGSDFVPTRYQPDDGAIRVIQNGISLYFPDPIPVVKFAHHLCGYEEWLEHKYALPGFVEVEPGDVVVDCGAYVGGFSRAAAKKGAVVHAFEPDLANFTCCSKNLAQFPSARVNRAGLFDRTGTAQLNISASSVEHSLLSPDDGSLVRTETIEIFRLCDYLDRQGLSRLNFLKLEAEGVEPEIFQGLGDRSADKIAIDISPERNGESPLAYFQEQLAARGYETRQRANVLFAKRRDAA